MNDAKLFTPYTRLIHGQVWAMYEPAFEGLQALAERMVKPTAAHPMIEKMTATANESTLSVVNGVGVFDVKDALVKDLSLEEMLLGGATTYASIVNSVKEACAKELKTVIARIDSPGGQMSGLMPACDALWQLRQSGCMTIAAVDNAYSAAYALASQCDLIVMTDRGGGAGSIGCFATCFDFSRMARNAGVDPHVFKSSDVKGAGNVVDGFNDSQSRSIQAQVLRCNQLFREVVARGRGVTVEDVNAAWPDAQTQMGAAAVTAKFADEMGDFDEILGVYALTKGATTE